MIMGRAIAKDDVKILMQDNKFSNFIKEKEYTYIQKGTDEFILLDEDKNGFSCNKITFEENFKIII